jgi:hypothetical protein
MEEQHESKCKAFLLPPWRRQGERMLSSYSFLTSAIDGGEWSASRPDRALPREKDPRYTLDRRLGGPQSWSGKEARGNILYLRPGSNPYRSLVESVVRHYYRLNYPGSEQYG